MLGFLVGAGLTIVTTLAGLLLANGFWWVVNHPNGGFLRPLWHWICSRLSRQRRLEHRRHKIELERQRERELVLLERKRVYAEWTDSVAVKVRNKMLDRQQSRLEFQWRWEELAPRDTYPFTLARPAASRGGLIIPGDPITVQLITWNGNTYQIKANYGDNGGF